MTSLSFAVMSVRNHPRYEHARVLLDQLMAQGSWTGCIKTGELDRDVWGTARRAWQAWTGRAEGWHIVIQDDAVLADDFVAAATKALEARGTEDCVVSFFSFADSVNARGDAEPYWLKLTGNTLYAVALAIPTRLVEPMLAWIDENEARGVAGLGWGASPKTRHDDKRILDWTKSRKIPAYVTVPNIVDHDPGPSIANPSSRARVSKNFLKSGAAQLDWSANLKAIPVKK